MDELPTKISSLEIKRRENKGEDDEFKCKKELYEIERRYNDKT